MYKVGGECWKFGKWKVWKVKIVGSGKGGSVGIGKWDVWKVEGGSEKLKVGRVG